MTRSTTGAFLLLVSALMVAACGPAARPSSGGEQPGQAPEANRPVSSTPLIPAGKQNGFLNFPGSRRFFGPGEQSEAVGKARQDFGQVGITDGAGNGAIEAYSDSQITGIISNSSTTSSGAVSAYGAGNVAFGRYSGSSNTTGWSAAQRHHSARFIVVKYL